MTTENLTFPLITQHNAEYPREIHAAREISRLLQKVEFPGHNVWVDLRFEYLLTDHSSSSLDIILIRGEPHGTVKLNLQGLYLMHDFESMLHEVIPHELAHVLHGLEAKVKDYAVQKAHDEIWQGFVFRLNPGAEPSAKVKGDFDERVIRLNRGGMLIECDCGGDESFDVIAQTTGNAAKLLAEEHVCSTCHSPYHQVAAGTSLPERIRTDLEYLEKIKCLKLHHLHLQR